MTQPSNKEGDLRSQNLYQKLAAITGEIGVVAKDGRNQEQKFAFIEYAAVAGRLRTLFAKYGVVIVPRMQEAKKQARAEIVSKYGAKGEHVLIDFYYDVVNADSPTDRFTVRWAGEATDYGDKATTKAATSALKYFQMRLFQVSEKGEDADEHTPEVAAAPPPAKKPSVGTAKPEQRAGQLKPEPTVATDAPNQEPLINAMQLKKLQAMFEDAGYTERDDRLKYIRWATGRIVGTSSELTSREASIVIDKLAEDIEATAEQEAA